MNKLKLGFDEPMRLYALSRKSYHPHEKTPLIAHFGDLYKQPSGIADLKRKVVPAGCLPLLEIGSIYHPNGTVEHDQRWFDGRSLVTGSINLCDIQECSRAFDYPFPSDIPYFNEAFLLQKHFCFYSQNDPEKWFMIPSMEVVRTFYAPSSNIATSLLAGEDPFAGMRWTPDDNTLKLTLSEEALPDFKDESVACWFAWLCKQDQLLQGLSSVLLSVQQKKELRVPIPPLSDGVIHYTGVPFDQYIYITRIQIQGMRIGFTQIDVEYERAFKRQTIPSAHGKEEDPLSEETGIFMPDEYSSDGSHPKTLRTFNVPQFQYAPAVRKQAKTTVTVEQARKKPGGDIPTPVTTNPMDEAGASARLNISPYADPLVPSLGHPEFDTFVMEINGLLGRRVISQADLRYPPFPYDAQRVYAVCECRDRWGRKIFLLEPGSEGSKTASTLVAPYRNGSMPEDFIRILLDNNGSWNRSEPLMQRTELVRHCRYRVTALEKHIQALRQ